MKKFVFYDEQLNIISETSFNNLVNPNTTFNKVQEVPIVSQTEVFNLIDYGVNIFLPYNNGEDFLIQFISPDLANYLCVGDYSDLYGCLVSEVFPYAILSGLFDLFKEVYKTGLTKKFSCKGFDDGELFQAFDAKISKSQDNIYLFSKDVSKLAIAKEKEKQILENSIQGILKINSDFDIVYCNHRLTELTGYSIDELNDLDLDESITYFYNYDIDSYSWRDVLKSIFDNNLGRSFSELNFKTKYGEIIYFKLNSSKLNLKEDFIRIYFMDLTKQVLAEQELEFIKRDLRFAQKENNFSFAYYSNGEWKWDAGICDILEIDHKYARSNEDLIANYVVSSYDNDDFAEKFNNVSPDRPYFSSITKILTPNGNRKTLKGEFNISFDKNGDLIDISVFIKDVTDEILVENRLLRLNDNWDVIQEVTKSAVGSWNNKEDIYRWNKGMHDILEIDYMGYDDDLDLIDYVHPEDKSILTMFPDNISKYDPTSLRKLRVITATGKVKFISLYSIFSFDSTNDYIEALYYGQDISEVEYNKMNFEMKSMEALKLKNNLDVIQSFAKLAIGDWDCLNETYDWTDEFYNILEVNRSEFSKDDEVLSYFIIDEDKEKFDIKRDLVSPENPVWDNTVRIKTKSGNIKYLSIYAIYAFKEDSISDLNNEIISNYKENIISCVIFIQDVTNVSIYENQLKSAISDKNMLLKEVHHRVKNNLQIIASLIRLDKRFNANDQNESLLDEIQSRISALALIHEKIYQSDSLAKVNIKSYIESIVNSLFSLYSVSIKFEKDLDDVELDMDTAIPLGLILNELVNNVVKYAFPEGYGTLYISLKQKDDDEITLIVSDDGVGLPDDFNILESRSLGFTVVNQLSAQLGGDLSMFDCEGTGFKLVFRE